jgi:4a-hydroxytetrahydrobiopterin dehydratase
MPRTGDPPLKAEEVAGYLSQIPDWQVVKGEGIEKLVRHFKFNDFLEALSFTNKVGELAEAEDHHPALLTEWGKVEVTWWTHAVKGLHLNDMIMAAKTDQVYIE